jgi:putative spermidine/putrescine transport system substrate-binding protein
VKKAARKRGRRFGRLATRRQFIVGGGSAILAGYAVTSPHVLRAATPEPEKELVFACNGGGTQRIFEEQYFPEFSRRHGGITVRYVPGQPADLVAKARAQRGSPAIDVIFLGGSYTYQAIDENLVTEVDRSLIPNLSQVAAGISNETAVVPVGVATAGVLTNTDVFARNRFPEPTSWFDFWDKKFKGHVGLYSINTAATNSLLIKIAQLLSDNYKNLDPAFAKLRELRPNMLDFYATAGAWETAMQQGDLWIGVNTATRAMQMKQSGLPVGFPRMKEGLVGYGNFLGLIKGAPHPTAAHLWINYMLSIEAQQRMVTAIGYNSVNSRVRIPEELKIYFPDIKDLFIPDWRYFSTQTAKIVDRWNREIER